MGFSLDDYILSKKKKSGDSKPETSTQNGAGFSIDEYLKGKQLKQGSQPEDSAYTAWAGGAASLYDRVASDYSGRKNGYQDSVALDKYVSKTGDEIDALLASAYESASYYEKYKNIYDKKYGDGTVDDILRSITANTDQLRGLRTSLGSELDYWSQFGSKDEYDTYQKTKAEYDRLLGYNVNGAKSQMQSIETQLAGLKSQIATTNVALSGYERGNVASKVTEFSSQLNGLTAKSSMLQDQLTTLERDSTSAAKIQKGHEYEAYRSAPDFAQFSKQGESIKNPTYREATTGLYIAGKNVTGKPVGNKVEFARANRDALTQSAMSGGASIYDSYLSYSDMTSDEVRTYNYLLAKEGEAKADEYLSYLTDTINYRVGSKYAENIEGIDSGFLRGASKAVYGLGAGLDQFASGTRQLFTDDALPTSATQYGSAAIREGLSDNWARLPEWMGGGSLAQAAYDAITTTGNMAPSILVSTLTGGLGAPAAVSGALGSVTMGASAAGNAYTQMRQQGYGVNESRNYSALVGASEGGLQYLLGGIGSLGGKLSGKTAESLIKNIDNAFLRIATETGLNMLSEGTEEYLQDILDPVFRNMTFRENNDFKLYTPQAMYSFLLGAVTAGMLEGPSNISNAVSEEQGGRAILSSGNLSTLLDSALNLDPGTEAYRLAQEIQNGTSNKNAVNVGKLLISFQQSGGDLSFMITPNAEANASDPVKSEERPVSDGIYFSEDEDLYAPPTSDNAIERAAYEAVSQSGQQTLTQGVHSDDISRTAYEASTSAQSNETSGLAISTNATMQKPSARVATSEKTIPNAPSSSTDVSALLETASRQFGADESTRFKANYDADKATIEQYSAAFKSVYDAAKSGMSIEEAVYNNDQAMTYLSYDARTEAYGAGQAPTVGVNSRYSQKALQSAAASMVKANGKPVTGESLKSAMRVLRTQFQALDAIGKKYGVTIVVQDRIDAVSADGKIVKGALNGSFDPETGKITIAVDSVSQAYLYVGTHELVHYIKSLSGSHYSGLEQVVFDALKSSGEDVDALVQYQMDRNGYDKETAREEVVANSVPAILTDEVTVKRIVETDRTLAERISSFFKELYTSLQQIAKRLSGESSWKQIDALKSDVSTVRKISDLFFGALESVEKTTGKGIVEYSEQQKENWSNSKRIVIYQSRDQLSQFIDDAMSGVNLDKKIYFGSISKTLAETIKKDSGVDISGYNCSLSAMEVKKILKDHGTEQTESLRGQRAITHRDFLYIPDVISDPDSITLSAKLYNGRPVLIFAKVIEGKITVTAYVSQKHLDLTVQTMFAGKDKGSLSTATGDQAPVNTPKATSGTTSNKKTVSRVDSTVKPEPHEKGLDSQQSITPDVIKAVNELSGVGSAILYGEVLKKHGMSYKQLTSDQYNEGVMNEDDSGYSVIGFVYRNADVQNQNTVRMLDRSTGQYKTVPSKTMERIDGWVVPSYQDPKASELNTWSKFYDVTRVDPNSKEPIRIIKPARATNRQVDGGAISTVTGEVMSPSVIEKIVEQNADGTQTAWYSGGISTANTFYSLLEKGVMSNTASSQQPAMSAPSLSTSSADEITDFGDKIGGARKDAWKKRGLMVSDLDSMNESEAGKYVKKDSIWPKIDYEKLNQNGVPRDVAFYIKQVRDSLPVSPQLAYKDKTLEQKEARRIEYISFVRAVSDAVSKIKTKQDAFQLFDRLFRDTGLYGGMGGATPAWNTAAEWYAQLTNKFIKAVRTSESRWTYDVVKGMEKAQFLVSSDKKLPSGVSVRMSNGIGINSDGERIEDSGTYYIVKGSYILAQGFDSADSATKWAQENLSKPSSDTKKRFVPQQLENIHRTGRDYRDSGTRETTGEDYISQFGFKGGEFGNWVNQNERQSSLNYGYDALMDLSDALGIQPSDISLGGKLSVAFGARGHGSALAHYEPDRQVINLTKMRGAGSLAHEWGHALDDILGQELGMQGSMTEKRKLSSLSEINKLISDMKRKPMKSSEAAAQSQKEFDSYVKLVEKYIDDLVIEYPAKPSAEQRARYNAIKSEALKGDRTYTVYDGDFDKEGEIVQLNNLRKELTGRVLSKDSRQNIARYLLALNSKKVAISSERTQSTDFYKNSKRMDDAYAKDANAGYWQSDVEMFARAFACYVTDKLAFNDARSDYLSGHSDSAVGITMNASGGVDVIRAFPEGEERSTINRDFDALINALINKGLLHKYIGKTEEYSVVKYSLKDDVYSDTGELVQAEDSNTSPREILANVFEGAAMNDAERNRISDYKRAVKSLDIAQADLISVRAQLKELTFAKGKRDVSKISELSKRSSELSNKINWWDKRLLTLEASQPLMDVVKRERVVYAKKKAQEFREWKASDRAVRAERGEASSARKSIEKRSKELLAWLTHPTDSKHVPESLRRVVSNFVEVLDFAGDKDTKRAAAWRDRMRKVKEFMEKVDSADVAGNADVYMDIDQDFIARMDEFMDSTEGILTISELNTEQLRELDEIIRIVRKAVINANTITVDGKRRAISEIGDGVIADAEKRGTKFMSAFSKSSFGKLLNSGNIKPIYFFKNLGGGMQTLFNEIREGQNKYAFNMQNTKDFYESTAKKHDVSSWIDQKGDVLAFQTDRGSDVEFTRQQALSLYATAKREALNADTSAKHLRSGGFVYESERTVEKKGPLGQKQTVSFKDATPKPLSDADLLKIQGWLTDEQRAFADEIVNYMSTELSALGNETALKQSGYKKFLEKYYFPYKTSRDFLQSDPGKTQDNQRWKHRGFTKSTVAGANTPVVIQDFTSVFANHVSEMLMYNAMSIPQENLLKVFNYKTLVTDDKTSDSVKASLQNAFGESSKKYVETFLSDLNGSVIVDPREDISSALVSKFKKGATLASLSTAIQQPSAIIRATALIDAKYLLAKVDKDAYSEAKKYAGTAVIKEIGGFDTGTGRSASEWLVSITPEGLSDKIKEFFKDGGYRDDILGWLPAKMDEITWARIWSAVKSETASKTNLEPGSEEFLRAAGRRFNDIIEYTQVYDSVISRSELMRSKSGVAKMATAFMAEPTVSYNMLYDAITHAKDKDYPNKVTVSRAVAAFVGSMVFNSLLKSIVYAARDDDDDQTYIEKYIEAVAGSLVGEPISKVPGIGKWLYVAGDLSPLTLVPYVRDILSLFQGYDVERADMSLFSDLVDAVDNMDSDKKTDYEKWSGLSGSIAALLGLPVKNVLRDVGAAYRMGSELITGSIPTGRGLENAAKSGLGVAKTDTLAGSYDEIVAARLDGDADYAKELERHLTAGSSGYKVKTQSEIDSGIATALMDNPSIAQAYKYRSSANTSQLMGVYRNLRTLGFNDNQITMAINRYEVTLKSVEKSGSPYTNKPIYETDNLFTAIQNAATSKNYADIDTIYADLVKSSSAKNPERAVKGAVTEKFKPVYIAYMNSGDQSAAENLAEVLMSRFGYEKEDLSGWVMDDKSDKMRDAINSGDTMTANSFIREQMKLGREEKTISTSITATYKPIIIEAYKKRDMDKLQQLSKTLMGLAVYNSSTGDLYYTQDRIWTWIENYLDNPQ